LIQNRKGNNYITWYLTTKVESVCTEELSYCWDGWAMLYKSNFRDWVGVALFNPVFSAISLRMST